MICVQYYSIKLHYDGQPVVKKINKNNKLEFKSLQLKSRSVNFK